jgi:phosphoserine phosphatase
MRLNMAIKMMFTSKKVLQRWPCGQRIQDIINLHRVRVDDETARLPRLLDREHGLAAGGRPRYQDRACKCRHVRNPLMLIATLIANPARPVLTPILAEKAMAAVGARQLYWLADGVAADLPLPGGIGESAALASFRDCLQGIPVDVVVQNENSRRKKLLIADMDSTMIDQECIDELADVAGLKNRVAAITAKAMNGEIPFEDALRERVALLKGLPETVVNTVIRDRITLAAGGRELIATMRKNGAYSALVSGGFTCFTNPIAAMLGFEENQANVLDATDGTFTGTVREPILGRQAKADALAAISARLGIAPENALAVGDGANDLSMLELAGAGVALHAKPVVAAQARHRIDHGDLTALLYMQGYRKADFTR